MPVEKLSISMDSSLLRLARSAAAEEGVSLSTWLSEAARAMARQRALRDALDAFAAEHGSVTLSEARQRVDAARRESIVIRPRKRRAAT